MLVTNGDEVCRDASTIDPVSVVMYVMGDGLTIGSSSLSVGTHTDLSRPSWHHWPGLEVATIFVCTMLVCVSLKENLGKKVKVQ